MKFTLNFSTHPGDLTIIGDDWNRAASLLANEGFDGLELYPVGDYPWDKIPRGLALGLHLRYYPILEPIMRNDRAALMRIFGDEETARTFYGGLTRDDLVRDYRSQFELAARLGCEYVVFHLAQSEFDHVYDWRYPHTWKETIDLCADLLDAAMASTPFKGQLLLENLWWPGSFRCLEASEIDYALGRIAYSRTGIVLDTGHVFNTNQGVASEREGIEYICQVLGQLGSSSGSIRGLHLTKSLSADYVRQTLESPQPGRLGSFWDRYGKILDHVHQIDRHEAFADSAIRRIFDYVSPDFVTFEFGFASKAEWLEKIRMQRSALGQPFAPCASQLPRYGIAGGTSFK
jgi:sugar phosphate isomerase/epimerase